MKTQSDERDDVVDYLVPFVREAHRQADLVICFLKALDVPTGTPLTPDLLLKIAAFVRIYQWERSGVRALLPADLPAARDIFDDIVGIADRARPSLSGRKLAAAVLWIAARQMTSPSLQSQVPDVVVAQRLAPEQMVDRLAAFLWQFRHLARSGADTATQVETDNCPKLSSN